MIRLCLIPIAFCLWAGVIGVVPAAANEAVKRGGLLAEHLCGRCHAVGKQGASKQKDAPPFREFSKQWPVESLEEALAEGIVTGHSDMPEFVLKPHEIGEFIAYLQTLAPKQ